jgi:hypothetical protein
MFELFGVAFAHAEVTIDANGSFLYVNEAFQRMGKKVVVLYVKLLSEICNEEFREPRKLTVKVSDLNPRFEPGCNANRYILTFSFTRL